MNKKYYRNGVSQMKDIVKVSGTHSEYKAGDMIKAAAFQAGAAAVGFCASRAVVFGSFIPFGLSVAAGLPVAYTPAAAIGIFLGYFFPAVGDSAFRYIAALFAILAIKLLAGSYRRLVKNPVFAGGICLAADFLTAAVSLRGTDVSVVKTIAESLLAAGAAYFVSRASYGLKRSSTGLSHEELSSILIVISIILTGISGIKPAGIPLNGILGVLLILTAAKYGGVLSGAVSGVAVAFSAAIGGQAEIPQITYAFGGLMAGVFASLGKYAQIGAVIVCCFVGSAATGDTAQTASSVIQALIGSALFLMLPRGAGIHISKLFSAYPKISVPTGLKKGLTMRLTMASNALKDVSGTVEQVSKELSKINSPDFGTVISGIEQDACAGCKLRVHCWETKREETLNAILEMTKSVKQGEYNPSEHTTEEFKGRCLRPQKVGTAVYKRYSDYASSIAAENRIDEVRSVVSDQFNGISAMLYDLACDFEKDEQFDNSAAVNAAAALKNLDIRVDECSSRTDKYGRMTIELKVKKSPELVINKMQVMKLISTVCERDFDIPNVSETGGDIFIVLSEHAGLCVDIGVSQICASSSSMCGDAYKYFYDGRGHFIMVLSDGMGTGGRAAVDGAMASGLMSRLIKAGFGYDCSLRILNSSMLFKSTDESLATVDIASIDLYTGTTELYKAGAAPTIVRRSGRTGKAESTSLPAGILRDIGFDRAAIKMKTGDIIVLMSDGAVSEGTDWIRAEVEAFRDGNAEELAEKLCECAKRRRSDNHEDDITVMTAIIGKAV